jgi:predicted small secreted protein
MKKVILTTVFILTVTIVFAQTNFQDVVYLKNGSVVRGTIIEQVPNESLKIETADGSFFVYTISEVKKITKERVDVYRQGATKPQLTQQEQTFTRNPQFGIKGGLNAASETASDGRNSSQTNARAGIHIGFFMELPINAKFDFQPELLYSMQGGSYKDGGRTYTDKIDYINLPIIFKWYVWQRRLSVDFGPQFGYMINAKVSRGRDSVNIYDSDELNKFDASLALGLSYKLTDNINLGLRGTAGLTNVFEGDYNYTNSVSQISIALKF